MDADDWVDELALEEHPEGGFFAEVYRSGALMDADGGRRAVCTHIYYLLRGGEFSRWHRIRSDEQWHFYAGDPLEVRMVGANGSSDFCVLGSRPFLDECLHTVVPAGVWFGARPVADAGFSLVGCTVAPGFDFEDFELADVDALAGEFAELSDFIFGLVR